MNVLEYYRKGFEDAINLMEMMGQDDSYDEWSAMLRDLREYLINSKVKEK